MDLAEAREHINESVIYQPPNGGAREDGVITSVSGRFVFVRYRSQQPLAAGQATPPESLTLAEG